MSSALIQSKSVRDLVQKENVKARLKEIMGERGAQFAAALVQLVNQSNQLQACDPNSVLGAALTAASLDLSIDPNIGEAHVVPYGDKAQFQIGYRGFIQLAMRSGEYKQLGSCIVREGELLKYDELTGELEVRPNKGATKPIIGYAAKFKLLNGFERGEFWTVEEIENHALMYSKQYRYCKGKPDKEKNCLWITKRDEMAIKTVEKSLLSHYGPKSIQMRKAIKMDSGAVVDADTEEVEYIDNVKTPELKKPEFDETVVESTAEPVPPSPVTPEKIKSAKAVETKPAASPAAPPKDGYDKRRAIKKAIDAAGVTEQQLIATLATMGGMVANETKNIETLPEATVDLVESQLTDFIQDIKSMASSKKA
jgi:recombination protein RecT